MNLIKLKNNIKIIILITVMLSGLVFFLVQCVQFFSGLWLNNFYLELIITVFFLGVAIAPMFILKSFVKKLTINKSRMIEYKDDEKEKEVTTQDVGGDGTKENGEV